MPRTEGLPKNLACFLDLIAHSELGELIDYPNADGGYKVIVGSTLKTPILFDDYSDHPRHRIWLPKLNVFSTAAGRYQILARYYDSYKVSLNLPDFSPESQDKIAVQMIHECHADADIAVTNIESAIYKCNSRWASFPGAGYKQHENQMEVLLAVWRTLTNGD